MPEQQDVKFRLNMAMDGTGTLEITVPGHPMHTFSAKMRPKDWSQLVSLLLTVLWESSQQAVSTTNSARNQASNPSS